MHLPPPTFKERITVCKRHLKLAVEWKGERTGIYEMRRHYTNYFKRIPNFKPYRQKLVEAPNYEAVVELLDASLSRFADHN